MTNNPPTFRPFVSRYDSGPHIGLKKTQPHNDSKPCYESDIPVCEDCRLKRYGLSCHTVSQSRTRDLLRKLEWVSTDIIVQLLRRVSSSHRPTTIYSNKNGTRHSKRLRQTCENEKRKFTVGKKTTIKDIKVKVCTNMVISWSCKLICASLDDRFKRVSRYLQFVNDFIFEDRNSRRMKRQWKNFKCLQMRYWICRKQTKCTNSITMRTNNLSRSKRGK